MKEIKFRAWGKNSKEYLSHKGEKEFTITELGTLPDLSVWKLEQYTGLKDKNGTEIYEGDILDVILHNGEHENYLIQWDEREAGFEAYNRDRSNYILSYIWDECEVIGNIFENPELMGGAKMMDWDLSPGAMREVYFAHQNGIRIARSLEELEKVSV